MALKFEIEKLDDVEEGFRGLYVEADGKFRLGVDGIPEHKQDDTLAERIKALEKNNQKLLDEKRKAKEDAARSSGDLETIEKSWAEKLAERETEWTTTLKERDTAISKLTSGSEARKLAADVFKSEFSEIVMPHITKRLTTEFKDGAAVVRVLDKAGKPSAMTIDDLKKEFQEDKAFAPLVVGSRANGGGDVITGVTQSLTMSRSAFEAMNPTQKSEFAKKGGKLVDK